MMQSVRKKISDFILKPFCQLFYKLKYKHLAPADKIIEINIRDIHAWYRGNRYDEYTFPGIIKDGDWSHKITPREVIFKNNIKMKSIEQRFKEGFSWRDTDLFKERYEPIIADGSKVLGFDDLEDLEKYYIDTHDKLFLNIKKHEILPASEENPDIAPIFIIIYKNGELLYTVDGNHRLSICLVLGIGKIPVKVWMRHADWQRKREYILSREGKNMDTRYRKYLDHPDIISELG